MRSLALGIQAHESFEHPAGVPDGIAPIALHEQLKGLAAFDQHAQNLVDTITLHGELAGDGIDEWVFLSSQQSRRPHCSAAQPLRTEDSFQQLIREAATNLVVAGESALVVLSQRARVKINGLYAGLVAHGSLLAASARDQLFDDAELVERRPIGVTASPVGIRFQPDGERFSKILGGMGLCVPFAKMMHVSPAAGTRLVTVGVL